MQTLKNKKVYFETYGCTFNFADTEKLKEIAVRQGCTVSGPEDAEAVVINTCTVVSQTERAMIRAINEFPDREIYVTGCMPVVQKETLLSVRPDIHIILPEDIYKQNRHAGGMVDKNTGVVQVGTGCLGNCAYCITRHARGRMKSFSSENIVEETKRLVGKGATEIQLTGQDLSAWGKDIGSDLSELLYLLNEIKGDFAVRVGMMNPATVIPILEKLVPAFKLKKIYSFAHLPVQAGSDKVLKTMQRGYTQSEYRKVVDEFKRQVPGIRISTDFIIGYPTETEEDFEESVKLLNDTKPTKVNITRFSVRENTPAALYKDMPDWIKKNRSRKLTIAANSIYDENNEKMIGKVLPVAVTEKKKKGSVISRDKSYNNIVIKEDIPLGTKLDVVIKSHRTHYLIAERV
ncbi:MiaB-like tRNA modifying enzyme [Methanomicrobium sp. W14]|uniref:tRNA (N(6)-L-threonylcarbamoyladenosine(37)-C(2))- methylthiotransferase n=1 Tax=Methanomicrobium sp. W14 TaxID=2817839 RepID=UPI001AE78B10|nr:tRNA (N(6)-L-threonylcarbamoyladenosine(37)-C(2))-methylthiotransferase [Methanomicrobium sp. W14]MBP2134128.1 MiaB-like tRNA modifying enzyme [Methanomicrobium sp. W14]